MTNLAITNTLVIVVLGLSGMVTSRSLAQEQWNTYQNRVNGFSIRFPANWETQEGEIRQNGVLIDKVEFQATAPREGLMSPAGMSTYVFDIANVETLDALMDNRIYHLKLNGVVIKKTERINLNGVERGWIVWTKTGPGGPRGLALVAVEAVEHDILANGKHYLIVCKADPKKYNSYVKQFEEILHSFKLEGKATTSDRQPVSTYTKTTIATTPSIPGPGENLPVDLGSELGDYTDEYMGITRFWGDDAIWTFGIVGVLILSIGLILYLRNRRQ